MLKDEGRILPHGVSEGLQDFPKMECMGWDWMGWDGRGWDGMGWDGMGWDGTG